jgi:hypothetical protein
MPVIFKPMAFGTTPYDPKTRIRAGRASNRRRATEPGCLGWLLLPVFFRSLLAAYVGTVTGERLQSERVGGSAR